jgi:DNA polymerase-3 subunit gamma/tau
MAHIALYRSWRPQSFADTVGQTPIIRTLQNALRENRLSHAYLFSGPRGTGKTSIAKLLAKAANCEQGPGPEPCNVCDTCRRITEGSLVDVMEIDAASNRGVDEIRDLRDKIKYAPTEVRRKVYIIDEVHMLTTEAFNALLKTLEEPPEHAMFILATTEPHKLPATIISRCQRFEFRRVAPEEQVGRLVQICREEKIDADQEALQYIAKLSEGGMRDAISLLDQIHSYSESTVTYESVVAMTGGISSEVFSRLARMIKERDVGQCLALVEGMLADGKSADKSLESLLLYFRDLLMIQMVPESGVVTDRILNVEDFRSVAESFETAELFRIIEVLNHYQSEMKYSGQPQIMFEVALIKLCSAPEAESGGYSAGMTPSRESGTASAKASPATGGDELAELKRRLALMEQQINRLVQNGAAAISPPQPAAGGTVSSPRASSGSSAPPAAAKRVVKLDRFIEGSKAESFKPILLKWAQVLAQVKEKRITVHAWLIDGEPVSIDEDTVLLMFKSAMHRETTERPANKQLIEQVMGELYQRPLRLATVMAKDWKDANAEPKESAPEVLQLTPEEPGEEEWVTEAVRLFGEDLVRIKEN